MVWLICTAWHQSNLSDAGIQLVFAVGWICLPIDRRICFRLKIIICSVRLSQLNQQLSPSVFFQSSGGAISDTLGTARRLHTRRTILQKYEREIWYLLKLRATLHKCPMCKKNSIFIWTPLHMHEQIIAAKQRCVKCSQLCLVKCSQSSARPSHDTFVIRFQLRPIFGYFHRQIAICWVVATGICHRRQPYLCNHHRRFVPHSLQMENLLCKSCFIL